MLAAVPRDRGFLSVGDGLAVDLAAVFVPRGFADAARSAAAAAVAEVVGLASAAECSAVARSGSGEAGCNALIAP